MRVVGLVSALAFAVVMNGCTKGGSVDSAAMEHVKKEYAAGMDKSLDSLYGKKPSEGKDKMRDYVRGTTSFKLGVVEKKSDTEAEVSVVVDQVDGNALGGVMFLAALGAGLDKKKNPKAEVDIPELVAKIEKEQGKPMPHEQKTVKYLAQLENDQWKFKELPADRKTASVGKKKK